MLNKNQNRPLSLRDEQTRLLYQQLPLSIPISLIMGLILTLSSSLHLPAQLAWGWYLLLSVELLVRSIDYHRYRQQQSRPDHQPHNWQVRFSFGSTISGLLWGFGAMLFYPHTEGTSQLVIIIILAGMPAGAVGYLGAHLATYLIYTWATLLPFILYHLLQFNHHGLMLGLLATMLGIALTLSVRTVNRFIIDSIHFRLESQRLAQHLQQANKGLQQLSSTDELTQIANRRYFNQRYAQEWQQQLERRQPVALLMIDVDYFKAYNDNYGHLAGDDCLRQIAAALKETIYRPGDLLARYGGEEFIALLAGSDSRSAEQVATRLHRRIAEMALPHKLGVEERISVSIGISSTVPQPDSSPEAFISKADEALYQAKAEGRNCSRTLNFEPRRLRKPT